MTESVDVFEKLLVDKHLPLGLLVCCGGFEDRSLTFPRRLLDVGAKADNVALLHYQSQREDNEDNYNLDHD